MPTFVYKAKKENAETVVGNIVAHDADEAVELVTRQGLIPVSVEEKSDRGGLLKELRVRPIRLKELYLFTRQLVGLLKSGVSLLQALEILARQSRNSYFSRVLSDIVAGIRNGRTFSSCLSDYPAIFSNLYASMARAGEESGRLRQLLSNIGVHYKKQDELGMKIKTALTYPIFMLVVGVATVIFILAYVMPRITVLFDGMKVNLPWPTVMVMALSKIVMKGWPILFVLALLIIILLRVLNQAQQLKKFWNRIVFSLPGVKDLAMKVDAERFARTLSLLLESGVPILRALEIAIPTLNNDAMKRELWICQTKVSGGAGLGEALRESVVIPDVFAQLIAVGEEAGELSGALLDIADSYEQEITETTKAMTTLLEPIMILVVGLVIGFIVFAMLMPIFQMDIFAR